MAKPRPPDRMQPPPAVPRVRPLGTPLRRPPGICSGRRPRGPNSHRRPGRFPVVPSGSFGPAPGTTTRSRSFFFYLRTSGKRPDCCASTKYPVARSRPTTNRRTPPGLGSPQNRFWQGCEHPAPGPGHRPGGPLGGIFPSSRNAWAGDRTVVVSESLVFRPDSNQTTPHGGGAGPRTAVTVCSRGRGKSGPRPVWRRPFSPSPPPPLFPRPTTPPPVPQTSLMKKTARCGVGGTRKWSSPLRSIQSPLCGRVVPSARNEPSTSHRTNPSPPPPGPPASLPDLRLGS